MTDQEKFDLEEIRERKRAKRDSNKTITLIVSTASLIGSMLYCTGRIIVFLSGLKSDVRTLQQSQISNELYHKEQDKRLGSIEVSVGQLQTKVNSDEDILWKLFEHSKIK